MSFLILLITASALVLSGFVFIGIWRQSASARRPRHGGRDFLDCESKSATPYRAVSIQAGTVRCAAIDRAAEGLLVLVCAICLG